MKTKFYAPTGCPVVSAIATGPNGSRYLNMLIDTGANYSSLNTNLLQDIGVHITGNKTKVVSAASVVELNVATVFSLESVGVKQQPMSVVVLDLPEHAVRIDGVLGVDFFKNKKLNIDFRKQTIEVKA